MIADQPSDEARLVAAEPLLQAKRFRIDGAEFGVVAAAALGDVVEERREVSELLARQGLHDLAQGRQFVVEFWNRQAPQIAHHEQRVRIHRVGMEQVVLHAPDDPAEGGNIAAEHPV